MKVTRDEEDPGARLDVRHEPTSEARGGSRIEERAIAFHGAARTHVTYRFR
ncbi:MAG: hypothetical protein KF837_23530 [Labilithrix sp.]|nr:hypothetical protein [Labilithrix sp.]